ncbi:hypothetical protein ACFL1D_04370 [Candidatus Omnitrophota bacterium]
MFGKKALSPEEKLLRIIEQPKAKAGGANPLKKNLSAPALSNFKAAIGRLHLLDLTNRLLFGAAFISTAFLILAFLRPTPLINPQYSGRAVELEIQKAIDSTLSQQGEYLQAIIDRNIFDVVPTDGSVNVANTRVEQLGLKLVGIIAIGKGQYQAMIEDKDGRTYLSNPNDTILGSISVESIEADKVVLKKGEEILELK